VIVFQFFEVTDERFPCLSQGEAFFPAHVMGWSFIFIASLKIWSIAKADGLYLKRSDRDDLHSSKMNREDGLPLRWAWKSLIHDLKEWRQPHNQRISTV
jgi:hypothetical protein